MRIKRLKGDNYRVGLEHGVLYGHMGKTSLGR
jgi:hypothetical protein